MFTAVLHHAPGWVWPLLAALGALGVWLSVPSAITVRRATIVPAALLAWSLIGVVTTFGASGLALAGWAAGIATAWLLSDASGAWSTIRWSAAEQRLQVPGSWVPMVLIMGLFATRFGVAAKLAMQPQLHHDPVFAAWVGIAYGGLSGLFLSRATVMWQVARRGRANRA